MKPEDAVTRQDWEIVDAQALVYRLKRRFDLVEDRLERADLKSITQNSDYTELQAHYARVRLEKITQRLFFARWCLKTLIDERNRMP